MLGALVFHLCGASPLRLLGLLRARVGEDVAAVTGWADVWSLAAYLLELALHEADEVCARTCEMERDIIRLLGR